VYTASQRSSQHTAAADLQLLESGSARIRRTVAESL
jgi:hypothetical protein